MPAKSEMLSADPTTLSWKFPLAEPGSGVLLGNGTLGLMVWGTDTLCLTLARNGFWDRRGGALPRAGSTYQVLRRVLESNDEAELLRLFTSQGSGARPTQLPGARLELSAPGWRPRIAEVDLASGTLKIGWANAAKEAAFARIHLARDRELAWAECDPALGTVGVSLVPMWNFLGAELGDKGFKAPTLWNEKERGGMWQEAPEDPGLAIAWQWQGRTLAAATALGDDPRGQAEELAGTTDFTSLEKSNSAWWKQYWQDVPKLSLPDAELQHAYLYGLFQQAGLTPAEGVAATLVGPWMEEMYMPGWSNDYHFNINVQMIYWPALLTNRTDHLQPLWDLILGWMPHLRQNARNFFEIDDGLMLPHAVNDRGETVDNFWAGLVDHACTAWMAQLAWLHYRYTLDERVLREMAWPLLLGAFNGYWAMVEERNEDDRQRLSLPITVSPEVIANGRSWGRDASFQLAALHRVADILPKAASILGEKTDARWDRVREELPPYSTVEAPTLYDGTIVRRVALWEGQDLSGSHRHFSHLAMIYPFATIDPRDDRHRPIMVETLRHWVGHGPAFWSGWSQPWAATLCARCDLPDAAVTWLHWWRNVYNNAGHGSDHNGDFFGCSVYSRDLPLSNKRDRPVIQLDGAMGTVTAILELLVQCRGDEIVVLPRLPRRWTDFSFDDIGTEGAFRVGATVADGAVQEIRVTSRGGGSLRLRHGLGEVWQLDGKPMTGNLLETATIAGQQFVLRRLG